MNKTQEKIEKRLKQYDTPTWRRVLTETGTLKPFEQFQAIHALMQQYLMEPSISAKDWNDMYTSASDVLIESNGIIENPKGENVYGMLWVSLFGLRHALRQRINQDVMLDARNHASAASKFSPFS